MLSTFALPVRGQDEAEAPADKPVVKVVNPGTEPRTQLRYRFQADKPEQMVMDMTMTMSMTFGGFNQPAMKMPTLRMVMDVEPVAVNPKGDLTYKYEISDVSVLPADDANQLLVTAMKQQAEGLTGLKGEETIDHRGFRLASKVEVPDDASAQVKKSMQDMQSSFQQSSAPFPEEAVGAGAVWTVDQKMTTGGAKVDQVMTYTITKIDGGKVQLDVKTKQTAKDQEIAVPQLGDEAKAKLDSLDGSGTGKIEISLDSLVPTSTMKVNSKTTVSVQDQTVQTTVDLDLKIGQEVPAGDEP